MHHRRTAPRLPSFRFFRSIAACVLLAGLAALPALAGQRNVEVSLDFNYVPATVQVNQGDHVTWIWIEGQHSVTSSDSNWTCPPTCTHTDQFGTWVTPCQPNWWPCQADIPNGLFDSGFQDPAPPKSFSWKATTMGTHHYSCLNATVHDSSLAMGVSAHGRIIVNPPGTVPIADFRITEIAYNRGTGQGLVEISNIGEVPGNIGRYRIVTSTDTAMVANNSYPVPAGANVVVHVQRAGAQVPPDSMFLLNLTDLPDTGSIALYVPNTTPGASLSDPDQMIDYVAWGDGGQANEATAVAAGLWSTGAALPPLGPGNSYEFCGTVGDYGIGKWAQIRPPNFGEAGGCTTPARNSTWGQLKNRYR